MLSRTLFEHILRRDKVPEKGTALQKQLEENSKILLEEVGSSYHPRRSVISRVTLGGSLTLADHILKPDNYNLISNAAPFYLGKHPLGLDTLPASAGVNFYLALITWQFYSQQNNHCELTSRTDFQEVIIQQNYYDKFYWTNGKRNYTCDQPNTIEHRTFMRTQAGWFMLIAHDVFQLEKKLRDSLRDAETTLSQLSRWFITSTDEKPEIYAKLGDYYLHIAYMEVNADTARTSSEERSSDELYNPKEADSQITNIGLHRRHKGSNTTSNPLFQPQAPTT